jgi:hypothetical protein
MEASRHHPNLPRDRSALHRFSPGDRPPRPSNIRETREPDRDPPGLLARRGGVCDSTARK